MSIAYLVLLPLATAFTAWLTARTVLLLLLYPLAPVRFFGITFHGFILRHQADVAVMVGEQVMTELAAGGDDLQLVDPETIKELQPVIELHLDNFLRIKLKEKMPVISAFIGDKTMGKLKEGMMEEIELLLPEIIEKYTRSITTNPAIKDTITQKIAAYPTAKLEAQVGPGLKKAAARVSAICALAGAVMGLFMALAAYLLSVAG